MAAHRAGKPVSGLGGLSIAGGCVAPSAGSGVMSKGTLNSKLNAEIPRLGAPVARFGLRHHWLWSRGEAPTGDGLNGLSKHGYFRCSVVHGASGPCPEDVPLIVRRAA